MKTQKERKRQFQRFIISLIVLGLCGLFWVFRIIDILPEALVSGAAFISLAVDVICVVVCIRCISDMTKADAGDDAEEMPHLGLAELEEKNLSTPTVMKLEALKHLLESCDIIDFLVSTEKGLVRLGATAETMPGKSEFFNKKYYVGDKVYNDIEAMSVAFEELFPDGEAEVLLIDGLDVKHWNIPR